VGGAEEGQDVIEQEIPGTGLLSIDAALLDMNGTLSTDGSISGEVADRLERLARAIRVVVATADTFGTARQALDIPGVEVRVLAPNSEAAQKEKILEQLGPDTTAAIGNGVNDRRMVARSVLGIAVVGSEGAAWETLRRARVVVWDARDALDLLLVPKRLVATLRD
jgi:soluble P-type ATPase